MPIPPRPVPAHNTRHRRPGTAIPRKSLYASSRAGTTQSLVADSRAEMAYLPPFAFGPSSAPNTLSGIRLISRTATPESSAVAATRSVGASLSRSPTPPAAPGANEVPLDALIDGRGRPKRTGAAAALGFDFVPRPQVLALDADQATTPTPAAAPAPASPRPSLWQWRTPETAPSTLGERADGGGALSSPPTPALEPVQPLSEDEEDDWEHVDHEDDAAVIVGELELEETTTTTSSDADGDRDKTVGHESYADAVRA